MKQARTAVNPYIRQANAKYAETVQPQVDAFNRAIKPHMDVYRRDVRPYVQQAYAYSLQSSSVSYAFYMDKVHPRVLQGIRQVIHFYQHTVDPALRRAFSLYVRPQVDRILAKVFERNVHAVGSDAVKDAKQEAQEAVKQADAHKKETVKEAVSLQNVPS